MDFFAVDFVAVDLLDFAAVLLPALAADLVVDVDRLTVFAGVLLAVREGVLAGEIAEFRVAVPGDAIASMRGGDFFAGIDARTCLMAVVCCSSVIRNSWWPSGVATKYRYGTLAGFAAAARLAAPGDATGPGGRPLCV